MKIDSKSARLVSSKTQSVQGLIFLCPRCRKHEISIDIWGGSATVLDVPYMGERIKLNVWHAEQGPNKDWETLSITPSVNRDGLGDPCGGWHGFITNGEAQP